MTKDALIAMIASCEPYTWNEERGDSWTDDQAEDAIVSMNQLIRYARNVEQQEKNHGRSE